MVFGTVDGALAVARRLHRRHAASVARCRRRSAVPRRSPYSANDLAALTWVHATLAETALTIHDLVRPPLTVAERGALLGGVPPLCRVVWYSDRSLPPMGRVRGIQRGHARLVDADREPCCARDRC
jgi:uncharacterized protein (DUF2236 family)